MKLQIKDVIKSYNKLCHILKDIKFYFNKTSCSAPPKKRVEEKKVKENFNRRCAWRKEYLRRKA